MGLRSCAGGTPTPPAAAHSRLNQCSGVTCSPPKVGGVPQRGEGVCTASVANYVSSTNCLNRRLLFMHLRCKVTQ